MRADGDSTVAIFPASQRSRGFKSVNVKLTYVSLGNNGETSTVASPETTP